jgi:hypothetical protein
LATEITYYNPISDGAGGPNWKPGGHWIKMGNLVTGILNDAADYWENCKCDGTPPIPKWVLDQVNAKKQLPPPVIIQVEIPDALVNYYDPSPWERFNKFMNQHFGQTNQQSPIVPTQITNWLLQH